MARRPIQPPKLTPQIEAGQRTVLWDGLWGEIFRDVAKALAAGEQSANPNENGEAQEGPAVERRPANGTGEHLRES